MHVAGSPGGGKTATVLKALALMPAWAAEAGHQAPALHYINGMTMDLDSKRLFAMFEQRIKQKEAEAGWSPSVGSSRGASAAAATVPPGGKGRQQAGVSSPAAAPSTAASVVEPAKQMAAIESMLKDLNSTPTFAVGAASPVADGKPAASSSSASRTSPSSSPAAAVGRPRSGTTVTKPGRPNSTSSNSSGGIVKSTAPSAVMAAAMQAMMFTKHNASRSGFASTHAAAAVGRLSPVAGPGAVTAKAPHRAAAPVTAAAVQASVGAKRGRPPTASASSSASTPNSVDGRAAARPMVEDIDDDDDECDTSAAGAASRGKKVRCSAETQKATAPASSTVSSASSTSAAASSSSSASSTPTSAGAAATSAQFWSGPETGKSKIRHPAGTMLHIVVVDETDALLSRSMEALNRLFLWPHAPGSRIVVLSIANAIDMTERFLPKLRAQGLQPRVIVFNTYKPAQLSMIIMERLVRACAPLRERYPHLFKAAFDSGVTEWTGKITYAQAAFLQVAVDPAAVSLICAKIANKDGDVRKCLYLLRKAVLMQADKHCGKPALAGALQSQSSTASAGGSVAAAPASSKPSASSSSATPAGLMTPTRRTLILSGTSSASAAASASPSSPGSLRSSSASTVSVSPARSLTSSTGAPAAAAASPSSPSSVHSSPARSVQPSSSPLSPGGRNGTAAASAAASPGRSSTDGAGEADGEDTTLAQVRDAILLMAPDDDGADDKSSGKRKSGGASSSAAEATTALSSSAAATATSFSFTAAASPSEPTGFVDLQLPSATACVAAACDAGASAAGRAGHPSDDSGAAIDDAAHAGGSGSKRKNKKSKIDPLSSSSSSSHEQHEQHVQRLCSCWANGPSWYPQPASNALPAKLPATAPLSTAASGSASAPAAPPQKPMYLVTLPTALAVYSAAFDRSRLAKALLDLPRDGQFLACVLRGHALYASDTAAHLAGYEQAKKDGTDQLIQGTFDGAAMSFGATASTIKAYRKGKEHLMKELLDIHGVQSKNATIARAESSAAVSLADLQAVYVRVCKKRVMNTITRDDFGDLIDRMESDGIITITGVGIGGGSGGGGGSGRMTCASRNHKGAAGPKVDAWLKRWV